MGTMASQIISLTVVYTTVWPGADQRKHQSSVFLIFVRGIHRWTVNSPHKRPVTRRMFYHLMTSSWTRWYLVVSQQKRKWPAVVIVIVTPSIQFPFETNFDDVKRDMYIYIYITIVSQSETMIGTDHGIKLIWRHTQHARCLIYWDKFKETGWYSVITNVIFRLPLSGIRIYVFEIKDNDNIQMWFEQKTQKVLSHYTNSSY